MSKVATIGIDLGTTYSCVAGYVRGDLTVIDNKDGERITPSVVCFDKEGSQPIVGSSGILAASSAPENFIFEVKRVFGKGFHSKEVQKAIKGWPFKVQEIKTTGKAVDTNVTDNIGIVVKENGVDKVYEPIQVSAYVLNYLYESAKQRLGIYPTFVAITVPAYFNDGAKQRTLDAANIAFSGKVDENNNPLDVKVVLLAEPTAAAIAYGSILMKNNQVADGTEERILVFDLGGGTYDVSVLDFSYDKVNPVGLVKATDGDNYLGGSDFDNAIIELAKKKYSEMNGGVHPDANVSKEEKLKNDLRLRQEAIKVKIALSANMKATFNLPCYRGATDLVFELSRVQFERACKDLFDRLLQKLKGVLLSSEGITPVYTDEGKLNEEETLRINPSAKSKGLNNIIEAAKRTINRLVMVGGSSRIPKVKSVLEDFFGEDANTPAATKKVISPLNPDEAIAYGAGYFANASCPDVDDASGAPKLLLIDQVPLNINIETLGGVATKIIEARTAIPCKHSETFSTAADNQSSVEIVITQGNRSMSADNYQIGRFTLSGIAPAPRGVPQIEVTCEIDQNNILKVTAVDKGSGSSKVFVENKANKLSEQDIENMKKQAESHAEQDAICSKRIQYRNEFESLIYQFQDKLETMQVDEAKKTEIKNKLTAEEDWLKSLASDVDPTIIKEKLDKFTTEITNMVAGQGPSSTNNANVEEVN